MFSGTLDGEEAVHGRAADWLALAGNGWTLVFAGATDETRRDPWFVRTTEYPGVGSSLAAEPAPRRRRGHGRAPGRHRRRRRAPRPGCAAAHVRKAVAA